MENLLLAGAAVASMTVVHILWTHPTPSNSFIKMGWRLFCWSVRSVRRFIVMGISAVFAKLWEQCVSFDRWAMSEHAEPNEDEALSEEWVDDDGHTLHTVPYSTSEIFTKKTGQNDGFRDSDNNLDSRSDGTEYLMTAEEVQEAIANIKEVVRSEELRRYLDKARILKANYEAAIDGLNQEHLEELAETKQKYEAIVRQVETQWKSELQMTEHDLRMQLSELTAEIDRLTRPDPHAEEKEQFRQLQLMRGAGLSRSQIVKQLLGGKMEGNSRAKYQREYDNLIWQYGVDWLQELHSYGLSPQKIVRLAWGDFKDNSEGDYIARVEKAIGPAQNHSNVVPLHRAG